MGTKRRRGRKPQGEYVGKSRVINFRITPATLAALKKAARQTGMSVSQQTEHLLHTALFDHGSQKTSAVMRTIGFTVDRLINVKNPDAHWVSDPYLFAQARLAMTTMLDLLAPREAPLATIEESLDHGGEMQGKAATHELLREIQLVDLLPPRAKQTTEQRALTALRTDLEDVADYPKPYGKSAAQTRKEARAIARTKRSKTP